MQGDIFIAPININQTKVHTNIQHHFNDNNDTGKWLKETLSCTHTQNITSKVKVH